MGIDSEDCRAEIEKAIVAKEPERCERMNQVLTELGSQEDSTPGRPEERK